MSNLFIVSGQWFYETVGKTWFIVYLVGKTFVHLKEPDTGSNNYLLYRRGQWLPAKMNDNGVFYIVRCRYGNFEFRGDEGPTGSKFTRASAFLDN